MCVLTSKSPVRNMLASIVQPQWSSDVLSGEILEHRILDIKCLEHYQQHSSFSEMQLEILSFTLNIISI